MSETGSGSIGARLQAATANLVELEILVKQGELDPRVLQEFRDSVDQVRSTAWAVQQWIGLQDNGDPYSLIPIIAEQRVRRATQLARDLAMDLDSVDVGLETPRIKQLYEAVSRLQERLSVICGR